MRSSLDGLLSSFEGILNMLQILARRILGPLARNFSFYVMRRVVTLKIRIKSNRLRNVSTYFFRGPSGAGRNATSQLEVARSQVFSECLAVFRLKQLGGSGVERFTQQGATVTCSCLPV